MYKGIFWIVDRKALSNNDDYLVKIETNKDGDILSFTLPLNSKKKNNYTHKRTWPLLDKKLVKNKPFDYYPRGRVEIRNGTCRIFLNPVLNDKDIIDYLIKSFNLEDFENIEIICDNSSHYKCYMDEYSCLL